MPSHADTLNLRLVGQTDLNGHGDCMHVNLKDGFAFVGHMGETREDRIREFLEENDVPVVGLREGAWLRVEAATGKVEGAAGARIFRRGSAPEERGPGSAIDDLLSR